eukprot:TRINITY_DN14443_c0_g1_i1.p1 TRINITY_DN14443_c0_g1~~TRINITY_DN14443_c0_g1_i1.p1  ORF type:complete len:115 (+),score=25.98 TRINITY_DN14443_c0_g1_i1:202-546(+)
MAEAAARNMKALRSYRKTQRASYEKGDHKLSGSADKAHFEAWLDRQTLKSAARVTNDSEASLRLHQIKIEEKAREDEVPLCMWGAIAVAAATAVGLVGYLGNKHKPWKLLFKTF